MQKTQRLYSSPNFAACSGVHFLSSVRIRKGCWPTYSHFSISSSYLRAVVLPVRSEMMTL